MQFVKETVAKSKIYTTFLGAILALIRIRTGSEERKRRFGFECL